MANRFVQARSYGGGYRPGQPSLVVIHSLEAPARRGLAFDLAAGWIQTAGVSPHHISDPGETVDTLHPGVVGWHCGNGNQYGVGLEVTGYAAWSRGQWLSGDALSALRFNAKQAARVAAHYGIPLRWLSLSQINNGERGFCTHNDISLTKGGTNHTDPGPGFPYADFMQWAKEAAGQSTPASVKPVTPAAPKPEEDNMKLKSLSVKGYGALFVYGPGVWLQIGPTDWANGKARGFFDPTPETVEPGEADLRQSLSLRLAGRPVTAKASDLLKKTAAAKTVAVARYTVIKGDTLSKIAAKYKVSTAQLVAWNKLPNGGNDIGVGQVLDVSGK